jgi:serine/threonine protein kinase
LYDALPNARPPEPFRKLADMSKKCRRCGSKFGSEAEYCPHDGTLLSTHEQLPDPLLGAMLLEQFRVDERIGVGGMGTVYRAHQTTVGRDVAIKVLRPELAADTQAVARFEREARLATALDHPNLVRVFLSGRLADGRLYFVMELLQGRSLAEELEMCGPPSIERAVIMIMKLCAGLSAVHEAGVVHRDIKPENVYLEQRGQDADFIKLVDFGVARVLDGIGPTTTQSGRVFGTAAYISPEAATGEGTDRRSDIYSLGVLSYQLLTGELPFDGSSAAAVLMKHVHDQPPLLQTRGRGADVPPDVADVVMQALSKDPEARQQTLAEFLDSLAQAAGNAGLLQDARRLLLGTVWGDELVAPNSYLAELLASSAPPSVPPAFEDTQRLLVERDPEEEALLSSAPKPFGTTSFDLATVPLRRKKRRHGWLWASLGMLAVVLVGVVAGTWMRAQTRNAPAPKHTRDAAAEESAPIADVGTDAPAERSEPAQQLEPAPIEELAAAAIELKPEPPEAQAPPKKKRRKPKKSASASVPVPVPASAPANDDVALEPDDGIDWTVPDFPEETGVPDAPARNPVVIDEPPTP